MRRVDFLSFYHPLKSKIHERRYELWVILVSIMILIPTVLKGAVFSPDTMDYVSKQIIRPPLYPLFIDFMRTTFGSHYLEAVVTSQCLLILCSAYYLGATLKKYYPLPLAVHGIVHFFLILPLLPAHRIYGGIYGSIANAVLTEALSYGIYLIVVALIVRCLYAPTVRLLGALLVLSVLNTLNRGQFAFMYAILLPFFLYLGFKGSMTRKQVVMLLMASLFLIVTGDMAERLYHERYNHSFGKNTFWKTHVLGTVLYLSDFRDLQDLPLRNDHDQAVMHRIALKMDKMKAFSMYKEAFHQNISSFYFQNFPGIIWKIIVPSFSEDRAGPVPNDELLQQVDSFSGRVLPLLLKKHFLDYARFTAVKFLDSFSFREGFFFAILFLPFFLPLKMESSLVALMILTAAMVVFNRVLIVPIIYACDRYLFYTDILEQAVAVLFMGRLYLTQRVHPSALELSR